MLKPMIKKGEKKVNPCRDESILKRIASMIKKWVLSALKGLKKVAKKTKKVAMITAAAGALATSLVSCTSEPTIPNHINPTPISGPVQPDDPTPISQYKGYKLTIENLTLDEKDNICDVLQNNYNNSARSFEYTDNNETKYKVETQNFCDDEFLSLVNAIECENGSFTLERTLYKLGFSGGMSQEQIQYVLDNIVVRNANVTIEQRQYSNGGDLYYTITIDKLLDLYQRDGVVNLFNQLGIEIGNGTSTIDVDSEGRYKNVDKNVIMNYYSGNETPVSVNFKERAGAPHSINLFNIGNNPYIEIYMDNGNEVQPTGLGL